ncbi:HNH endonuclease [Albimonas sp. CAU 1670]|uniref:HNH endonuclease n=1 Tax=Albimonas sp. CAU 1670 TaxID=3032599 RepID=UPI0023DC9545|nr:HNH endonuclease [Albimonas sp. CAU 1670]MDF2232398.1 HNH endonuclease [Albimonas sp. CAU 1670]
MAQETKRNPTWTRDELILALDHYVQHPSVSHDPGKPEIMQLAKDISAIATALGLAGSDTFRNANGVSMKLLNFRAHDPDYTSRGQSGLKRGNKLEAELWVEFAGDPKRLAETAAAIRAGIAASDPETSRSLVEVEPDIAEAEEGRVVTRMHRSRERNRKIVARKKADFEKKHGRLFCEACGFDFAAIYGERGEGFIECHHTVPVSKLRPGDTTKLSDLVLLCANCHRMVHVRRPWLRVTDLRQFLRAASSN